MIKIEVPESPAALGAVRGLMREFVTWHRERHASDIHLVDSYFDPVAFDAELASLPRPYAAPQGRLLLARWHGRAAVLRGIEAAGRPQLRDEAHVRAAGTAWPRRRARLGHALGV